MDRLSNLYLIETEDERILYVTGNGASGGEEQPEV
jgi:hypothetical protein